MRSGPGPTHRARAPAVCSAAMRSEERAPVSVAVVNDFELVVLGVATMLAPYPDRVRVVELDVGGTPDTPVDVALVDSFSTDDGGLWRAVENVRAAACRRVALYTWHLPPESVPVALANGVDAILSKDTIGSRLVEAIERVHQGEQIVHRFESAGAADHRSNTVPTLPVELTPREAELLAWLTAGITNAEMASAMYLAETTVKSYLQGLYRKLGVANRTQAAALAVQWRLTARNRAVGAGASDA